MAHQGMANMYVRVIALVTLLAASSALHAQYPAKPMTLVVPFSAGSDADLSARNHAGMDVQAFAVQFGRTEVIAFLTNR